MLIAVRDRHGRAAGMKRGQPQSDSLMDSRFRGNDIRGALCFELSSVRERHGERVKKQRCLKLREAFHFCRWIPAFAGMTKVRKESARWRGG